jgi:hypothetical protein
MTRLLFIGLLIGTSVAFAQSNVRIRGTITAVDSNVLSVKSRDGKDLKIHLAKDLGVSTAKALKLSELPANAYVGSAATRQGERLVAIEVHTLPPQVKPGHTPWDLEPGSTMTNAHLAGIAQVTGGHEITMNYQGGSQKIFVPEGTPVVTSVPGTRSDLKPGEYIFSSAQQDADGKITAQRITVSKDGIKPPQ